jgi:hypothetical protein
MGFILFEEDSKLKSVRPILHIRELNERKVPLQDIRQQ